MNKRLSIAALCTLGILLGCNQQNTEADPKEATADTAQRSALLPSKREVATQELDEDILLTVNGQPVTKAMYGLYFQDRMRNNPNAQNSPEMQMTVLNELANVLIVAQDAESQKLDQRPEIAATLALLRAKLLTQTLIQDYAESHQPTEAEIQSQYDADYANKSSIEYKARHILLKEEEQAKELIKQLDAGGDFAELAKTHSTGPTGKDGGDLGWFDAAQMVKPFADAVQEMETGKYTAAPVKTQFGWHVILLEETRDSPPPSLEEVKPEISAKLQQQALADYMQGLRAKSKLEFNEKAGLKKKKTTEGDS